MDRYQDMWNQCFPISIWCSLQYAGHNNFTFVWTPFDVALQSSHRYLCSRKLGLQDLKCHCWKGTIWLDPKIELKEVQQYSRVVNRSMGTKPAWTESHNSLPIKLYVFPICIIFYTLSSVTGSRHVKYIKISDTCTPSDNVKLHFLLLVNLLESLIVHTRQTTVTASILVAASEYRMCSSK